MDHCPCPIFTGCWGQVQRKFWTDIQNRNDLEPPEFPDTIIPRNSTLYIYLCILLAIVEQNLDGHNFQYFPIKDLVLPRLLCFIKISPECYLRELPLSALAASNDPSCIHFKDKSLHRFLSMFPKNSHLCHQTWNTHHSPRFHPCKTIR